MWNQVAVETNPKRIIQVIAERKLSEITQFLTFVTREIMTEPVVLRKNESVFTKAGIIGDLHGDLQVAITLSHYLKEKSVSSLVFLGDYVDRGPHGLETLVYILSLKAKYPKQVVVLKGNHEDIQINQRYGFLDEIMNKYQNSPTEEMNEFLRELKKLYDYLPLACITPQQSFCVHGGIPVDSPSVTDLAEIPRPYSTLGLKTFSKPYKRWYDELLWNDPADDLKTGYRTSFRGSGAFLFSKQVLLDFLGKNKLQRIIRGHEARRGRFASLWGNKLIHVHPTSYSYGNTNGEAKLYIDTRAKI